MRQLAALSREHPNLAPLLTQEMAIRAGAALKGVALYRAHPARRGPEKAKTVWQQGTTRLLAYEARDPHAPAILIIPALINRFTILDVHPDHSFVQTLTDSGFRVFIVDWDVPGIEENAFGVADYVTERLCPVLDFLAPMKPHVMGYCMGGVLALALTQIAPQHVRSRTLLATPWDFHAGFDATGVDGRNLSLWLAPWLSGGGAVSDEAVQSLFTAFQPLHAFRKFASFAQMDQDSAEATRFVLAEDWLNDGVPLTASVARECFEDWCGKNILANGAWRVAGTTITPDSVTVPTCIVVAERDKIVPPESARVLANKIPNATILTPPLGHIGLMSSSRARAQVWDPVIAFLCEGQG